MVLMAPTALLSTSKHTVTCRKFKNEYCIHSSDVEAIPFNFSLTSGVVKVDMSKNSETNDSFLLQTILSTELSRPNTSFSRFLWGKATPNDAY